ncbi:MAG: GntR family transcriptional regulator [Pseudomonadota bacterium]
MNESSPDIRAVVGGALPSLARRSLGEEAADALRELILLEKLAPGTPVRERDLAEALGISRTPLKEALRLLEAEGLVEYSTTRRPRVANPTIEDIADNLAVLGALEGLAGELSAHHASDEEIAEIAHRCREMRARSDTATPLDFFRLDMAFHRRIVAIARNAALEATHGQYNARLWRARFISSRMRTSRENTLRQHDDIVTALEARDAKATRQALKAHLETAVDNIAVSMNQLNAAEDAS